MKIRFASKVIKFEQVLEFKEAILLCYEWLKQLLCNKRVFKVKVWAIA